MAYLKPTELSVIRKFIELQRGPGYVLDFSDSEFQEFMRHTAGVEIYSRKYEKYGSSKGKRFRAFWEDASDETFGKALKDLLEHFETQQLLHGKEPSGIEVGLSKAIEAIADKLLGSKISGKIQPPTEDEFLNRNYGSIKVDKLQLNDQLVKVLNQRISEAEKGLKNNAPLSVIFLCGSSLEGIILGLANNKPQEFNVAKCCPKDIKTGKIKPFLKWSLNDLINVAYELGYIGLDVKKHSHSLRDFRNYIHPFEQCKYKFNPDQHTAEISWQVLRAAINDLNNKLTAKESV